MKLDITKIPNDWTRTKLRNVGVLKSGSTPERTKFDDYFHNGTIYWVKTLDLNNGIIKETDEKITEKALKESSCSIISENSVLVAMYGGFKQIGRTGLLSFDAAINQAITAITLDQKVEPLYLLHWLNNFIGVWRRFAASSRKDPNITRNDVCDFPIAFPLLPEQKKIAEILSTWDSAIETCEKLISANQTRKRALMQCLLTGKQRFPQFVGQAWKEVSLGKIFKEIKDTNDGGDNHSVMTISARLGLISQKQKFDRVIAGKSLKKYTQLKQGDFAYNKGNSKIYEMGCIYQLENVKSALVPFVYICFRPTDAVFPTFYKHWFFAHGLDRQLKRIITSGARGDGLLNVNKKDFFKLKVPFPPKEEQEAIAKVFESVNTEIELLEKQRDAFKEQKRGLMQKLLTGKVRVKVDSVESMEA